MTSELKEVAVSGGQLLAAANRYKRALEVYRHAEMIAEAEKVEELIGQSIGLNLGILISHEAAKCNRS